MSTEAIVYLLRKTNLTRSEMGKLSLSQFNEILKEVYFQESVDRWERIHELSILLSTIHNAPIQVKHPKFSKEEDYFKGDIPVRNPKPQDSLDKMAADKGIKLPSKELKER